MQTVERYGSCDQDSKVRGLPRRDILPEEVSSALALEEGDEVFVSASAEGIQISPYDPDFDEAMADAREFMRTHLDAFRKLAE
jgi:hypothetical protein